VLGLDNRRGAVLLGALLIVAVLGYLVGHGHRRSVPPEKLLTVSVPGALLEHPPSWEQVKTPPHTIAGLPLQSTVALVRAGRAEEGVLLAGRLPGGEPAPLPRSFTSLLQQVPRTEVVAMLGNQAFRYTDVRLAGLDRALTLYAVPQPEGYETVIACETPTSDGAAARSCERIVSTLSLESQAQSYTLSPEPAYARPIAVAVTALEKQRSTLRGQLASRASAATVQRVSERLSTAFADAVTSISALEAPQATQQAQNALLGALKQAQASYSSLARTVREGDAAGVSAARKQVYASEAGVDAALEGFALLGYEAS
jgi:hypothetical protein